MPDHVNLHTTLFLFARTRGNDVLSQQNRMGVAMFARHIMFMNSLKNHELRQLNFVLQPLHNFQSNLFRISQNRRRLRTASVIYYVAV